MPEVEGIDKLLSMIPKKRFGVFSKWGMSQMGFTNFGDDDVYSILTCLGVAAFGVDKFADFILLSGIYRTDNVTGEVKYYREPYYITRNPRTDEQQTNRQKYADGVAAWQALTSDEKNQYNIRAKGKRMSGYNLFLKEYMLS